MPPSACVLVRKGSCEEASVVRKYTPCDMENSAVLGEYRAPEESCVVSVKRDGPKQGRCGARLATQHRAHTGAVTEIHHGWFARTVIGALCVDARSRLETDSNLSGGPERVDVVATVGPLLSGRASAQCGVGVCVGGTEVRGRKRHRQCGSIGPGSLASER